MYRDAIFPNSFAIGSILFLSSVISAQAKINSFSFPPLDSRSPIGSRTSFAGMTKKENGKNMGETPVLRKSQF